MTDTDDVTALEAAGFEVVSTCTQKGPCIAHVGYVPEPGDLIVRRRPPEPVEAESEYSECLRMYYNALLRDRDYRAERVADLTEFRAALARERAAAEQRERLTVLYNLEKAGALLIPDGFTRGTLYEHITSERKP